VTKTLPSFKGLRPLTRKERQAREQAREQVKAFHAEMQIARARSEAESQVRMAACRRWVSSVEELWTLHCQIELRRAVAAEKTRAREGLLRCVQGDVVRKRNLKNNPSLHCEVLHIKGNVFTIRNLFTRQRESAPVEALRFVRRGTFLVNVFSVEEGCSKGVEVHADMTVKSFVEQVQGEFGLEARRRVQFSRGCRDLFPRTTDAYAVDEAGLGLRPYQQLSVVVLNRPFTLQIVSLSGLQMPVFDVDDDTSAREVLEAITHRAGPLPPDTSYQLAVGTRTLRAGDGHLSLAALGICAEGPQVSYVVVKHLVCPQCSRSHSLQHDVMIGATHEGWGLKWNCCKYSCVGCCLDISYDEYVSACGACRCFWHVRCL